MLPRELHEGSPGVQVPFAPRRDHGQLGSEGGIRQLEADLVIALAGGAVTDRVRALAERDVDLRLGDERARDRGAHEVGALVDGVGTQHGKDEVPDEFLAQIADVHGRSAGAERLVADGDELLALPQIGAVGDHLAPVGLDEPAQDDGGVEPA